MFLYTHRERDIEIILQTQLHLRGKHSYSWYHIIILKKISLENFP